MSTTTIKLEPFFRIKRAGCDISVATTGRGDAGAQSLIYLTLDGVAVTFEAILRDSRFSNRQMEHRIRCGLVPFGTKVYCAVERLADAAETLFGDADDALPQRIA